MRLADGRYLPVERATMHATTGSGPGGQHRNRSQTRVELRLPLAIMGLTPAELDRIRALLHQRIVDDELVVVRDIPFHALCEHHLLPFTGVAHVGYIPGPRIVGLSKLARVVDMYSRDLQVQERMTAQVANWLEETLQPRGVGIVLEAEHLCMTVRGVRAPGSRTTTSSVRGLLRHDPRTRAEFFALVGASTGA